MRLVLEFNCTAAALRPLLPLVQRAVADALALPVTAEGLARVNVTLRDDTPPARRGLKQSPRRDGGAHGRARVDVSVSMPSASEAAAAAAAFSAAGLNAQLRARGVAPTADAADDRVTQTDDSDDGAGGDHEAVTAAAAQAGGGGGGASVGVIVGAAVGSAVGAVSLAGLAARACAAKRKRCSGGATAVHVPGGATAVGAGWGPPAGGAVTADVVRVCDGDVDGKHISQHIPTAVPVGPGAV